MGTQLPVDPALEAGYNVRLLCDDFEGIVEGWLARSAQFRANADASLDCAYDEGERDKLDIFRCGQPGAPLFVFIHGGYWQRGDKSIYSFVAEPFLARGVDVALLGYKLCPDATMTSMTDQIRKALAWLWRNGSAHGLCADRINLSGHSAGGHLTGMMLATDWTQAGGDLPADLIKAGIPISGLYQLEPLLHTTISHALHLTEAETSALSPYLFKPASDAPILATLGGGETSDFHWQTDQFVEAWSGGRAAVAHHAEPDVDHFGVVDRLADGSSAIFEKTIAWLK